MSAGESFVAGYPKKASVLESALKPYSSKDATTHKSALEQLSAQAKAGEPTLPSKDDRLSGSLASSFRSSIAASSWRSQPQVFRHETLQGCDWRAIEDLKPWSTDRSALVCPEDKFELRREFLEYNSVLLPTEEFSSISKAVEHLNSEAARKPDDPGVHAKNKGHCIVFSTRSKGAYVLFLKGRQQDVCTVFEIPMKWSASQVKWLCPAKDIDQYRSREVVVLDEQQFTSVRTAIHALAFPHDVDLQDCPSAPLMNEKGFGIVFSSKQEGYFLMYKEEKKEEAHRALSLKVLERTEKRRPSAGNSILSWCQDFYRRRVRASPADTSSNFNTETLVGTLSYHLTERYNVVKEIGSGAQGTAYLVKRRDGETQYCAKESHNMTEKGIKEFREEFEKMKKIRHPNCVRVEELLECPQKKQLFIILEYASGGDLYHYMSGMKKAGIQPTEQIVAGLMHQGMSGVAYLHSQGFVHNDLKPDNLLVMEAFTKDSSTPPRLVITDYGCATHEKDTRRMFGDPRYQSPESMTEMLRFISRQIAAPRKMKNIIDIWSMGVTLFEVLTGVLPFIYQECTSEQINVVFDRLSTAVLDMTEVVRIPKDCPISTEAEDLLKQLLSKDWNKRPSAQQALEHNWYKITGHNLTKTANQHITFTCTRDKVRQILRTALASKLRYDHLQQCHAVFKKFDPDASGTIELHEFRQAYEEMGKDMSKADEVFESGDIDGNKLLEFSEFAALTLDWTSLDSAEMNERIGDLIHQHDPTGSGQVPIEKFKEIFAGAIEEEELQAALQKIDIDGDGQISVRELKAFVELAPPYVTGREHTGSFVLKA